MLRDSDRHIVDSIADLLDSAGGLARVRRLQSEEMGFDHDVWSKLAANGWLGAAVPEAQGGVGLALREIALLLEHAGKRLMPEPLVAALAGSAVLAKTGAAGAALLDQAIRGETICVAIEPESGVAFSADREMITGASAFLVDGHVGDHLLALVTIGGSRQVVAIPQEADGVQPESRETVDGGAITRFHFDAVRLSDARLLMTDAGALDAFRGGIDFARLGYAALLVGLADEALAITVQYLKDRKQFGVPIGSFQALQHRAASLYVITKASRALLYEACRADDSRRSIAALAAKSYAAETAMTTVKECVQLHGAMGYTAEHNMSLYFRRAMTLAVAGGDAISCRKALHAERALLQDF